jgi:hypothetical protein
MLDFVLVAHYGLVSHFPAFQHSIIAWFRLELAECPWLPRNLLKQSGMWKVNCVAVGMIGCENGQATNRPCSAIREYTMQAIVGG